MSDYSDEKYSYKNLLKKMLDNVPPDLDTREGSVIWNAIAPNAMVLSQIYDLMAVNQRNQYADTADRNSLIRLCSTRGITPYPATSAEVMGKFYSDMATRDPYNPTSGSTFYVQDTDIVFKVVSQIDNGVWKLICTTPGEIGNVPNGRLIPIYFAPKSEDKQTTETTSKFAGGEISEILIYGEDIESTDALRERYYRSFEPKAYAGNKAFYIDYTEQIPGVGKAKVFRGYKGPGENESNIGGYVGIFITDANNGIPTSELMANVKQTLDPNPGEGIGVAPIDHIVNVFPVEIADINVAVKLTCTPGITWESLSDKIKAAINTYFSELIESWSLTDKLVIKNIKLQSIILAIPNVLDITDFTINGLKNKNIELTAKQIPKLGTLTGTVV